MQGRWIKVTPCLTRTTTIHSDQGPKQHVHFPSQAAALKCKIYSCSCFYPSRLINSPSARPLEVSLSYVPAAQRFALPVQLVDCCTWWLFSLYSFPYDSGTGQIAIQIHRTMRLLDRNLCSRHPSADIGPPKMLCSQGTTHHHALRAKCNRVLLQLGLAMPVDCWT